MTEQYANSAQSTLNGDITLGAASLVITAATAFPSGGNFRILIDSELIVVGAVAGTTFSSLTRGAESTTAAAHTSGATITHVLTATGYTTGISDRITTHSAAADPHADRTYSDAGVTTHTALPNAHHTQAHTNTDHTTVGTPGASAIADAAAQGASTSVARLDHVHGREALGTAPTSSAVGDAAAAGTGTTNARVDHVHGREGFVAPAVVLGTAAAAGVATTHIRSDSTIVAFDATVPVTQASADAAAAGTAAVAARRDHKHGMPTSIPSERLAASTTPAAVGTAAVGVGTTDARADHVHATGAGTPAAVSTANATGTGPAASMTDHVHAHETAHVAHDTVWAAAGDLVVGTGAATAAKLGITVPAANILNVLGVVNAETTATWKSVHDGTAPTTSALADAAAAGTSLLSAHRDHTHGRESFATNAILLGSAAAAGAATTPFRSNDTIAAFDVTVPTTSALGDAATVGTAAFAARRDHLHGREAATVTRTIYVPERAISQNDGGTNTSPGTNPDVIGALSLADGLTQGFYFHIGVPSDWSSGAITYKIYWVPGSTDAVAHTVRWSTDVLEVAAATDVTSAGTTSVFTGSSAARTINQMVIETSQTLLTPTAVNNLIRADIRRVGADAADTYVGAVIALGVLLTYTANR